MQETFIDYNSVLKLSDLLAKSQAKRLFIVTGKESFANCGAKDAFLSILADKEVVYFSDFKTNPDLEDVKKGIKLFRDFGCDVLISVGGGSVIDMAKLINYYSNVKELDLIEDNLINNAFNSKLHICMPTTAGSGSEATHFAVMYVNGTKFSIADQKLVPDTVIIDPSFHLSQTPYQKAVSGADALAQSIESFWSINANKESSKYSLKALDLIFNNMEKTVLYGERDAHMNLAHGSYYAGKAINIAKTTAPHALSYGITTKFGIPHGHAVSLFLPYFVDRHIDLDSSECNDLITVESLTIKMQQVAEILNVKVNEISKTILQLYRQIGIETNFEKLGIDLDGYTEAAENVNLERLANNPSTVDRKVINDIFKIN